MKVKVTKEQIETAIERNSNHCMIADAIKAQNPSALFIFVDIQSIRFSVGENRYYYFTPPTAQINILKFDRGIKTIKPFTFYMKLAKTQKISTAPSGKHKKKSNKVKDTQRRVIAYRERQFGIRRYVEQENKELK